MPLPPAQPAYILRGHAAQIHSTAFIGSNTRLVSGDADGWIVIWSLEIKRPVAVWRAHEGAILGAESWGEGKLITHGKDNKLIVWKFSSEDEPSMSTVLPVDTPLSPRKQPWLLHVLHVNTMNFCSFAQCPAHQNSTSNNAELLIAVPNTIGSETVDIFHLPSEKRIHTVPNAPSLKGGMIMVVSLFHHPTSQNLTVISGYESGHTSVSYLTSTNTSTQTNASPSTPNIKTSTDTNNLPRHWTSSPSATKSEVEPTSSPASDTSNAWQWHWQTTYLCQPHTQPILSLDLSPAKDYYLTSSADAIIAKHPIPLPPKPTSTSTATPQSQAIDILPIKTIQTHHSGQQSLRVRNDGKIFATAGWDARIRVYGCKNLRELAVLKWHKEGCFAVGFADVGLDDEGDGGGDGEGKEIVKRLGGLSVREERIRKTKRTHWLVAGSKDGKVSLWDIY